MKSLQTFILLFIFSLLICVCSIGCKDEEEENFYPKFSPPIHFDLDSIKKRGKLILLTENGPSTYYQYRGQTKGFDYELVKEFAKHLGVKLEVRLLDDVDLMFQMLNNGDGDIIASNLTATPFRKRFVAFASPVYKTRQVLVQRKYSTESPDSLLPIIKDTLGLNGANIFVHKYSSFYMRLRELEKANDFTLNIKDAPGEISTEDLLRLTSEGEINMTVTDENLAIMQRFDYPQLDMTVPIGPEEDIAWAVRSNASGLLTKLNDWMEKSDVKKKIKKTHDRYFLEESLYGSKGPYALPVLGPNQISPFDSLFKKYAPEIGWDWRLLAAVSYQESRFNPEAQSWSGAFGVMQLMPETAARFDCDTSQKVEPNIRAAAKYIKHLDRFWKDKIIDPNERVKFVLASYNIGPGHILDARAIARHLGKPDTIWTGNVDECLLLKTQEKFYRLDEVKHGYCHAQEPYHFVGKILAVYEHYRSKKK
ncbi:MAG: transporter substrate-binding domain-containing protein [Flavobacteriales bacterium]